MFDLYIDSGKEILRNIREYKKIVARIKEIALRHCENAEVYVFGSVLSGKVTASSDIDVLIIANLADESRTKLKADILRELGFPPVEIHVVSKEEFKRWYSKFIDKIERI